MKCLWKTRAQSCQGGLERVAGEAVCVLPRHQAIAKTDDRRAMDCRQQNPEHGLWMRSRRKDPLIDRMLDDQADLGAHLLDEAEPLPVTADLRHVAFHEHEREVLRVRLAELVHAPEGPAYCLQGIRLAGARRIGSTQDAKPFLRQREEDVVLAREIAVDRTRAVFDALRNLSYRDVVIPLGDEEIPGRVQNGSGDSLALALLTFFNSQKPSGKAY